ncbi:MAG: hypothetical protein M1814_005188 [Vezdaea aestivalis]|nr:MAG: hypothetical protein M1814_005188 [Vezdaea aestivalis]
MSMKPSQRISYPDLKVGIPALLLCIEMAIFAVLHVFAFSWKPYVITAHPVQGMQWDSPKDRYYGGNLGIQAYIDAYNPWDLIKAVGRSFRWIFIGRRHRHTDSSYGSSEVNLSPSGPPKVTPFGKGKQARYEQLDDDDDSRPMLGYSAPAPMASSNFEPMRTTGHKESSGDISSMPLQPDDFTMKHPTPGTIKKSQGKASVADEMESDSDFQVVHKPPLHSRDSDTAYHGSARA